MPKATPFLKWAGGKSWLVPDLVPEIQKHLDQTGGTYFEPFLGGGAVALALGRRRMILADTCTPLIQCYRQVVRSPEAVSFLLKKRRFGEESYYAARQAYNSGGIPVLQAARFIYLNKTCFNGLYRVNRRGAFNVPWGKRKTVSLPSLEKLQEVQRSLASARFVASSFRAIVKQARKGDLIYADPPYDNVFGNYAKNGFTEDDQRSLACLLEGAWKAGARVFATNADTALVREIYAWAKISPTQEKRNINSNGKGRGAVPCVLVEASADLGHR